MANAWHEHQITGGNGKLGGESRTLGTNRVLGYLHHQGLPLPQQGTDIRHGPGGV